MNHGTKLLILGFYVVLNLLSYNNVLYAQTKKVVLQKIDVKAGDTLWSIANYYLKDPRAWPEILKHNKLSSSDPNVILPGMKLNVPVKLVKEHLRPAHLVYVLNEVRYRRRNTVRWSQAKRNMKFYNEDSVRTMKQAKADVRFLTGEIVKLDENSLIVLRPEKKREEVKLFSGAVRASRAKVLTETTVVNPKIDPKSPNPDFKTKVKKDKTTLVQVYEGIVDVTAEGKTVTLTKGFGTEVKHLKPPSPPRLLPPEPKFKPSDPATRDTLKLNIDSSMQDEFGKEQTRALSTWEVTEYHLQIAADKEFNKILIDKTSHLKNTIDINKNKFNLKDGIYYYRVALVNEMGFESKFSAPEKFAVDTAPPVLELYQPIENEKITTKTIPVNGKTEPKITIIVGNKIVPVDKGGNFSTTVLAKRGLNHITIIAKDTAGNFVRLERNIYKIGGPDTARTGKLSRRSTKPTQKWLETPAGIITFIGMALVVGSIFGIF
jgi:LysM repeat protein